MHQSGNCIHLYSLLGYKQDFVLLASAAEQEAASTKTQEKKNNEFFGKMALLEVSLSLLTPAEPCRKERALPGAGLERARSDSAASSSEPVCE